MGFWPEQIPQEGINAVPKTPYQLCRACLTRLSSSDSDPRAFPRTKSTLMPPQSLSNYFGTHWSQARNDAWVHTSLRTLLKPFPYTSTREVFDDKVLLPRARVPHHKALTSVEQRPLQLRSQLLVYQNITATTTKRTSYESIKTAPVARQTKHSTAPKLITIPESAIFFQPRNPRFFSAPAASPSLDHDKNTSPLRLSDLPPSPSLEFPQLAIVAPPSLSPMLASLATAATMHTFLELHRFNMFILFTNLQFQLIILLFDSHLMNLPTLRQCIVLSNICMSHLGTRHCQGGFWLEETRGEIFGKNNILTKLRLPLLLSARVLGAGLSS
ncbi:hypothetical protein CRG98_014357 [Punica granatum]|uniref:Uncharacterized protein n=1 Tax=Punica granatum TaxID=22663 RepID=A0A2I0K9I6_PUNGR|nr:hypothetical protein CRG98_014357 [Punica granatum]